MAHLSQEEQLKLIADLEIEMMADMYNRYDCGYHVPPTIMPPTTRSQAFPKNQISAAPDLSVFPLAHSFAAISFDFCLTNFFRHWDQLGPSKDPDFYKLDTLLIARHNMSKH